MNNEIILLIPGFMENEQCFSKFIDKFTNNSSKFFKFDNFINLDTYYPANKDFLDPLIKKQFYKDLDSIINFNLNHQNTKLVINVRSGNSNGFEKIEIVNERIIFLIEEIYSHTGMRINLIGHSQGGVSNLVVVTRKKELINKMVSIATPYSLSMYGALLNLLMDISIMFLNINPLYSIADANILYTRKETDEAREGLNILATETYYNNAKAMWNNLEDKPDLLVISTVSSLLKVGNRYYPYDGILTLKEQLDIEASKKIVFIEDNLKPILENEDILNKYHKIKFKKKKIKKYPDILSFDLLKTGFSLISKALSNFFSGKGLNYSEEMLKIFLTVKEAWFNEKLSNETYKSLYDAFINEYSHLYIKELDEVISSIKQFFN